MKILFLNWKDRSHPLAGGAEVVTEELCKRLAADGHEVTLFCAAIEGAHQEEKRNGYTIIRRGSRYDVYWQAYKYYRNANKHKSKVDESNANPHSRSFEPQFVSDSSFDLIIDEMNTVPFFAALYAKVPVIFFVHQLAREIWFYEIPFPLSLIGYIAEAAYLRLLSFFKMQVVTVSESTKEDLMFFKFKEENISIISEGIELEPLEDLDAVKKFDKPTVLSLGALRSMKQTEDIIEAFEIAKKEIPELELIVAGKAHGKYGAKIVELINTSSFTDSIRYEGAVNTPRKIELMQKSHILAVTSIKEGWGLVVTEAASQGTPAVVYNVDGLRDSVRDGQTGLIAHLNTPAGLAAVIEKALSDPTSRAHYTHLRRNAWEWSKEITFERCYGDFAKIVSVLGL